MLKAIVEIPTGKIVIIGLNHEELNSILDGYAITVRIDDMGMPMSFRDVLITIGNQDGAFLPTMSREQAASTAAVVMPKTLAEAASQHNGVGELCARPLKDRIGLFMLSAPTNEELRRCVEGFTNYIGAIDMSSEFNPSNN